MKSLVADRRRHRNNPPLNFLPAFRSCFKPLRYLLIPTPLTFPMDDLHSGLEVHPERHEVLNTVHLTKRHLKTNLEHLVPRLMTSTA